MQFDQHQALDQAAAAPLQGAEPFRLMPFGLELSLDGLPLQRLFRVSDCLDQHINGICRLSGAVQGGEPARPERKSARGMANVIEPRGSAGHKKRTRSISIGEFFRNR